MYVLFLCAYLLNNCHLLLLQDRDEQKRLEMKHRKEEDDLYRKFARHREEEDKRIREEFRVSFTPYPTHAKYLARVINHTNNSFVPPSQLHCSDLHATVGLHKHLLMQLGASNRPLKQLYQLMIFGLPFR